MILRKCLRFLVLIGVVLISNEGTSQISMGLNVGIFQAIQKDFPGMYGGEISANYDFTDHFRTGINVGVYRGMDNSGGVANNASVLPISALAEYVFLEDKFRPYVGAHLGAFHSNRQIATMTIQNTYFSVAPVAGIQFMFTEDFGSTFNAKYPFTFLRNEFTNAIEHFPSFNITIGCFYRLRFH